MSGSRRPAAMVATVFAMILSLTVLARGASAAPYVHAPTLSLSTTNLCTHSKVTVVGTDFVPNSTVQLTLRSATVNLGSVHVNATGGFSKSVQLPTGVTGAQSITAAGTATASNSNTDSVNLTIGGAGGAGCSGAGGTSGSGNHGGGGLAFTGAAVLGVGMLGLALLGGGFLILFSARRRRPIS